MDDYFSAPFTPLQVERLNLWQFQGGFHPYTCGGERTDEHHLDGEGVLMATLAGWKCPYCSYTQDNALKLMAEPLRPPLECSTLERLQLDAAHHPDRLVAAYHAERGHRLSGSFRGIILSVIAMTQLPMFRPLLLEQLQAADPWLRYWADKGVRLLDEEDDTN